MPTIKRERNLNSANDLMNQSFDDKYDVFAVMALGEDGNTARRIKVNADGSLAISSSGSTNASLVLEYTGDDLTKITKTINGVSYERTLSYTDGKLTGVSSWGEI